MKYRHLEGVPLPLAAICLGSAQYGSQTEEGSAFELLDGRALSVDSFDLFQFTVEGCHLTKI